MYSFACAVVQYLLISLNVVQNLFINSPAVVNLVQYFEMSSLKNTVFNEIFKKLACYGLCYNLSQFFLLNENLHQVRFIMTESFSGEKLPGGGGWCACDFVAAIVRMPPAQASFTDGCEIHV